MTYRHVIKTWSIKSLFLSAYPVPSGNKPSSEASHMATGPIGIHPLTLSYCTGFSPRGTDNTTPSGTAILEGLFPYLSGSSPSPKTSLKSLFFYGGAPLTNERAKLVNNGCFSSSSTANRLWSLCQTKYGQALLINYRTGHKCHVSSQPSPSLDLPQRMKLEIMC